MTEEEKIKQFEKEQLEILLNDLQDINKFTGFRDGSFKFELGKYQANLLVNCIKGYKEVIDKAKELINKCVELQLENDYLMDRINLANYNMKLLDILKEVE